MRISQLAERAGVPVATIKFYLREGLLQRGTATAANQARYDEAHLHRLSLIRALREVGGLDLRTIRGLVEAIEDPRVGRHELLGIAQAALGSPAPGSTMPADVATARDEVDAWLDRLGWRVRPDAPARATLAEALAALRRLGRDVGPESFARYARTADELAGWEVEQLPRDGSRSRQVEGLVVGTLVHGTVFEALRRLAHEHHSADEPRGRRR